MDKQNEWFADFEQTDAYTQLTHRPIAYFCAEFALSQDLPTYAGGLGVLAADVVKEAADKHVPFVAVGLYYHEGYLHHEMYSDGTMLKHPRRRSPEDSGFVPVVDEQQQRIVVSVPMQGRKITIVAWEKRVGDVRMFMLAVS